MKKTQKASPVSALKGGRKTAKVAAEARRLTDNVRRLGIPQPKSEYRLAPSLGTTFVRASRYKAL